jgi:hypothetical protein
MPFIYKPSLWGFTAAAVFIALTIIEVQDSHWVYSAMWGLLAVSFLTKYMPKLIVFGPPGFLLSFVTLVAGGAMFVVYASDRIGN